MADEKKTDNATPPATNAPAGNVPVAAKDSGQTQPPNSEAKDAVQATEPGKQVTAAEQAGEEDKFPEEGDYVLKEGQEHSAIVDGELKVYTGGDKVRLTAAQAASFGDKFESPKAKK